MLKKSIRRKTIFLLLTLLSAFRPCLSQNEKPRARDLGIPFEGTPGPLNTITDVKGVEVGHTTLISGEGKLIVSVGPVRTGVTAVLPRGKTLDDPVFAGWYALNGNGEMTGTTWIEESGFLEGPVMITNTHSVGIVRDAVVAWRVKRGTPDASGYWWSLPVVAETYDGYLNDINGFHVKQEHVFKSLENAKSGTVPEGNVGGGTGMICYGFKGGIGTASRILPERWGGYTVGVLVQANFGSKRQLTIAGVPVGKELSRDASAQRDGASEDSGSIIVVVATDAPLLPHQLKRLARRVPLGLARTGSTSGNSSGDIFIAFSTANANAATTADDISGIQMISNRRISFLFTATVEATEEAVINALIAAETMTGADGHKIESIPHEQLKAILKKYNRLGQGSNP